MNSDIQNRTMQQNNTFITFIRLLLNGLKKKKRAKRRWLETLVKGSAK